MPAVGDGMISLWDGDAPLFGPWFTYGYGTGGAICSPEPKAGIVATAEGMCINWSGCGTGQGAAVGFKVCAAPKYPNEEGDSSFFPRACTGTHADSCVPSETAKPYSFCGGSISGVKFAPLPMALTVAFLDDTGTNGTVIKEVKVAAGGTLAELPDGGERVAAVHFKLPNPPAQGSLCVSGVEVLVTPRP
jgi:hypothetical protein